MNKIKARWKLLIVLVGFIALLFLGFMAMSYTNTTEFCTSCHSMKFQLEDYKKSRHYNNPTGVRAGCPDCHVPHDLPGLIKAKLMAVNDVIAEITTDYTPEKWEEERPRLAMKAREKMLNRRSRECWNCHERTFNEDIRAHKRAKQQNLTCIQCHYNLVHKSVPWPEMEKE